MMKCPRCQTINSDQQKFCHECGSSLPLLCPRCKTRAQPSHKFCGECGLKLGGADQRFVFPPPIESEGERTHVTVLFSDLCGYTALSNRRDPEEIREISGGIFKEIAKIVAGYHGFIEKFVGDAVLAIFGLPAVHEDDPRRAVSAALKIHRFVQSIRPISMNGTDRPLYMHSGIHTGLVVTGEMIVEQGVHGIVGDTLNLASRLADIAKPNEILVSSQTHQLISSYYETERAEPVRLKGFAQPVIPFRIKGEREVKTRFEAAKQSGFSAFTGRQRELADLRTCLKKAVAGRGQIVTITGEAGMGKSRLAYEFCHTIDRDRITVLRGHCHTYGGNTPYLPLLDALKRYLSLNEEDTYAQLEQKIAAQTLAIDPALEQYLPVYLHLLSIPSQTYRLPKHLAGQKLKNLINQALAAMILMNAKRKPTILVLEDWHWVDEASDSILMHLAGLMESYPLMIVVLYRPERTVVWPDWHYRSSCVLKAMDVENTAHIIQAVWKVDTLPQGFSSFVHEHTGGNPFFIEEVCRTLFEDSSVRLVGQEAILVNPVDRLKLPASVQAVIKARLDRLDRHAKETLQRAAVIGREFPLGILERISDTTQGLPLALEVLKAQELIRQSKWFPDIEYKFKHVLTQVTAYESLLLKKRRAFHAAIGRTLEQLYADRLEEQCENIAHHYSNSTNMDKALIYLKMAGNKASRVHSHSEARRYYELALTILEKAQLDRESQQNYIDLSLKWAEVSQYAPSNKIRNALVHSLEYATTTDNRQRIAEVSYWVGKFSYMQGDFIEAIPQIEHSIRLADALNDHQLLAVSYNLLGRTSLYTCNYSTGIGYLNEGISLIQPFKKWDDIVYSTAILGLLTGITGNFKSSLLMIAEAIRIARKYEIPTFEAMAFGYLGAVQYWYGHMKAAINNCNTCIAVSQKLGNPLPVIWATLFRGAAFFNLGAREKGLRVMSQSIDMMTAMDSVLALRYFYSLYAESLALNGNYPQAEAAHKKAMALSQSGQKWGEIASSRTKAILAARGSISNWRQVDRNMKKSIEMSTREGTATELLLSIFRYADLLRKKGDEDAARNYHRQGRELADRMGCNASAFYPEAPTLRHRQARISS